MNSDLLIALLMCAFAVSTVWALIVTTDYHAAAKRLERLQFANKFGLLLGRTVEAKVYDGSKWERMVIVAVSWRGAVAVRPEWDLETKARWIPKCKVAERVRAVSIDA